MRAQLPVDCTLIEEELPALFRQWDINNDGALDANELLDREHGLLSYIMQRFPKVQGEVIPDIRRDKSAWFHYFDYDKFASPPPTRIPALACHAEFLLPRPVVFFLDPS